MQKSIKHPDDPEDETFKAHSENSIGHVKYIKNLELQRSVLNKIIEADFSTMNEITAIDPDRSELRASLRNNT